MPPRWIRRAISRKSGLVWVALDYFCIALKADVAVVWNDALVCSVYITLLRVKSIAVSALCPLA